MPDYEEVKSRIERYFQLSEDEALDIYDVLDTMYNELKSRYLEALMEPDRNRDLVEKVIRLTLELLGKESRTLEEELQLIALLDILATDLHDRTVGFIVEESEEEGGKSSSNT